MSISMHNSSYKPPRHCPYNYPVHSGLTLQSPTAFGFRVQMRPQAWMAHPQGLDGIASLKSSELCCHSQLPKPSNCSLLALLARLLGASRALTRRLERRPLDGGDALLEACRARPRERSRLGKGLVCHASLAQARFRVVVDGGAEAAREQPVAACLALAARGRYGSSVPIAWVSAARVGGRGARVSGQRVCEWAV